MKFRHLFFVLLLLPVCGFAQLYDNQYPVGKLPLATAKTRGVAKFGSGLVIDKKASVTVDPLLTVSHLDGGTVSPAISASTGAGTSPTLTVGTNSTDLAGSVTVVTGSSPAAAGIIFRVTFAVPYKTAPFVQVRSGNETATPTNATAFPTNVTTTGFDFKLITGSTLPAGTNTFIYQVFQ